MAEEIIKTPKQAQEMPKRGRSKLILGIIIFLVAAVLAAGGFLLYRKDNNQVQTSNLSLNYKNYSTYTVKGASSGSGMSFDKPTELLEVAKDDSQVELMHSWTAGSVAGVTYIAGLSQAAPVNLDKDTLANINKTLADSSTNSYKSFVSIVNKFISDRLVSGWQTQISPAKQFANPNIKDNAWSFDFTSTYGKSKLQGRTIYAIGAKNYYFFFVYSTAHNWQANPGAWQHIFNSLKIDQ